MKKKTRGDSTASNGEGPGANGSPAAPCISTRIQRSSALVHAALASESNGTGSAATREVEYNPGVELSMFFLSSMFMCTKAGQNLKPTNLSLSCTSWSRSPRHPP